mgnify:CR=1 FL=1
MGEINSKRVKFEIETPGFIHIKFNLLIKLSYFYGFFLLLFYRFFISN